MNMTPVLLPVLIFAANPALGAENDEKATDMDAAHCPALQASTVFISDATGRRHSGTADRLTEQHREAESRGWDFDDLEIYIENGDLQGFFVTYTRPHPCNQGTTHEP